MGEIALAVGMGAGAGAIGKKAIHPLPPALD